MLQTSLRDGDSITHISRNIHTGLGVPSDNNSNESTFDRIPSQSDVPCGSTPIPSEDSSDEDIYKEWVTAAMVLDRLFLWIFFLSIIVMTVVILTDHPEI